MREAISILTAALTVALFDQCYIAIWYPHAVDSLFVEFVAMLISAICVVAVVFLLLVIPIFVCLRRSQRRISWPAGLIIGFALGALASVIFISVFCASFRVPVLVGGSVAGAVGVSIYARLISKRVA